jgi:hypothetical protein
MTGIRDIRIFRAGAECEGIPVNETRDGNRSSSGAGGLSVSSGAVVNPVQFFGK